MRVLVLAALVTLVGCTLNTDYFTEYRGKNILSNYGFEASAADGTAKWALEPVTTEASTNPDGHVASDFMTWADVSADTALVARSTSDGTDYNHGPDGTSPAYRLEIKNLVTNGDFEDSAVTPAGSTTLKAPWVQTGGGDTSYGVNHTANAAAPAPPSSVSLDDVSLWWFYKDTGNYLSLNLTSMLTAWPLVKTNYRFRMDYMAIAASPPVVFALNDDESGWTPESTTALARASLSKSFLVSTPTEAEVFQIGSPLKTTNIIVDNVRMVPELTTLWVKTSLPSLGSGSIKLLPGSKPGMYVLTFAVRDDPFAGVANRFQPTAVTVRVVAKVKSGTANPSPTVFLRPTGGWASWTTLTMNFGFDFVTDDADKTGDALTIELTPTNWGTAAGVDAGSVLVAQPKLTFNP